jgi:hypothetical protein
VREREKARGSGPYGPLFGLIAGMVFVFRGPCARQVVMVVECGEGVDDMMRWRRVVDDTELRVEGCQVVTVTIGDDRKRSGGWVVVDRRYVAVRRR